MAKGERGYCPGPLPTGLNSPLTAGAGSEGASCLDFCKMHGLGNDFVVIAESDIESMLKKPSKLGGSEAFPEAVLAGGWQKGRAALARALCNRHFGVGADGLIVVSASSRADCRLSWTYINGDGSDADMCGNGLRCLALWAHERGLTDGRRFNVETARGPMPVAIEDSDRITVDMGEPVLESVALPVAGRPRERVVREKLCVDGRELFFTGVNMGNPHCVLFNPPVEPEEYLSLGPEIQALDLFPEGVNVEFVLSESPSMAKTFVWERGCGPTLACATGACAVVVAGVLEGVLDRAAAVELPGGTLAVAWSETDNHVRITGPARELYRGTVDLGRLFADWQER